MTIPTFGPTTRYFNGFRWKCIKDYTPGERVLEAVYNKRNRSFSGHLTVPVTVTSVKDFRPLYVSNHPGLELSCTEEQELIYQNHLSLERKTFRNFFTTYEETCDKYLPIWFPTEHLAGDDRLTRSQIKKIADGIMEQQIPDPAVLLELQNIETNFAQGKIIPGIPKDRWESNYRPVFLELATRSLTEDQVFTARSILQRVETAMILDDHKERMDTDASLQSMQQMLNLNLISDQNHIDKNPYT